MNPESNLTVICPISLKKGRAGQVKLTPKQGTPAPEPGNLPRVTRLMALAIKLDADLQAGRLKDLADIARLSGITRARATQIMNLLHLAPDIQEKILFLPRTVEGRASITERALRDATSLLDWSAQRNRLSDVLNL